MSPFVSLRQFSHTNNQISFLLFPECEHCHQSQNACPILKENYVLSHLVKGKNPRYFKPSDWNIKPNILFVAAPADADADAVICAYHPSGIQKVFWCHGLGLFYGIDSNFGCTQLICTSAQTYNMNMLWVIILFSYTASNSIATNAYIAYKHQCEFHCLASSAAPKRKYYS